MDVGPGGGTYGGGGGDGRDRYGDRRLIKWEDTVANITLGKYHNALFASTPGSELHHPTMSTLGENRGQLERERDINKYYIWRPGPRVATRWW